jgi:recombinational DNA repair protein RecT
MSCAIRSAALGLSVDPAVKQAHLVPFKKVCTLIPDYHGLVMMMERTNYYRYINVSEVFEGEIVEVNRFTGVVTIIGERKSKNIIGWCAYTLETNGTERFTYMKNEDCDAHGLRYNPGGFNDPKGAWGKNREEMRRKTCLRCHCNKWGKMSAYERQLINADVLNGNVIPIKELPSDENLPTPEKPKHGIKKLLSELGICNAPDTTTHGPAAVVSPSGTGANDERQRAVRTRDTRRLPAVHARGNRAAT